MPSKPVVAGSNPAGRATKLRSLRLRPGGHDWGEWIGLRFRDLLQMIHIAMVERLGPSVDEQGRLGDVAPAAVGMEGHGDLVGIGTEGIFEEGGRDRCRRHAEAAHDRDELSPRSRHAAGTLTLLSHPDYPGFVATLSTLTAFTGARSSAG